MFDLLTGMTGLEQQETPGVDLLVLVEGLLAQASDSRQRRTLVLAGESDWCRRLASVAAELPELKRVVWVSSIDVANMEMIDAKAVKGLLGQECNAVVFDAHSGFDPDAFGAICGTICAGGLLILLCPSLSEWEKFPDPASERIAISPFSYKDISGRFIRRLIGVIRDTAGLTIVEQNKPLPLIESAATSDKSLDGFSNKEPNEECRTEDQQAAVEAIEHVVHGHRRRPAVLVSDRGRGKSAALGIAAAHLLIKANSKTDGSKKSMRIVATAPRPSAVEALFFHVQRVFQHEMQQEFPEAKMVENYLQFNDSKIQYVAPDELCLLQEPVDLVLVDEAAAIPASILSQFLKKYSRIAFATTVHGYEGTGRGFAVRFRQTLDNETPDWNEVRLRTPIRWAENDPLEQLVFRSLLLDAESVEEINISGANSENVMIEKLDRETLVNDEQTLSQLFGLLVTAHYRTTPNDLRNLLDGPGVSVYVMRFSSKGKDDVIATALVSAEGDFSDELTDEIFTGQRRPRGHLIPQSLVTHVGIKQAAKLRCARVMRIAVHPALQRKNLGSKLVSAIRQEVEAQGFDLMGVSFGATAGLMHFWETQGMRPVRVGFRRDHASAEHSVMMLVPLRGKEGKQSDEVYQVARSRLLADLPYWLADSLQDLCCAVVVECMRNESAERLAVNELDEQAVIAFANGARSYEDCSAALWRFTVEAFKNPDRRLQDIEQTLLVARVLQKRTWKEVAMLCDLTGRAEVVNGLRNAALQLLEKS